MTETDKLTVSMKRAVFFQQVGKLVAEEPDPQVACPVLVRLACALSIAGRLDLASFLNNVRHEYRQIQVEMEDVKERIEARRSTQ